MNKVKEIINEVGQHKIIVYFENNRTYKIKSNIDTKVIKSIKPIIILLFAIQ